MTLRPDTTRCRPDMTSSTRKTPMKKTLSTLAATLATTLAMTTAVAAQQAPKKVTVGYLNLVNAQLVTKNLGLMAKHMPGVEIAYIKVGGGGDMLRAIAADQIDFGGLGNPPATIAVARGLPIQGTMVLNMLDYVEAMVVRDSAGIKSFKDLRGKTLAAPFGSTTHYLLMQALTDEGIDPADMKILDLRPGDIAVAWARGDIDAAWFWEPNLDKAVKDGGHIFMTSGLMEKRGYPTWDVGVVMNEFAEKYPAYVEKFVAAECEGIAFWIDHPAETAAIIAEELELPLDDATRMMRGTEVVRCDKQLTAQYIGTSDAPGGFVDTLEATATFLVSRDRLPEVPARAVFENFLHPEYLEAVVAK
ncbi:MAG: taurine transport system substrate-binding protein [Paracoccaceae bacterium]|jgi:taurine transport system substrate-binding protein